MAATAVATAADAATIVAADAVIAKLDGMIEQFKSGNLFALAEILRDLADMKINFADQMRDFEKSLAEHLEKCRKEFTENYAKENPGMRAQELYKKFKDELDAQRAARKDSKDLTVRLLDMIENACAELEMSLNIKKKEKSYSQVAAPVDGQAAAPATKTNIVVTANPAPRRVWKAIYLDGYLREFNLIAVRTPAEAMNYQGMIVCVDNPDDKFYNGVLAVYMCFKIFTWTGQWGEVYEEGATLPATNRLCKFGAECNHNSCRYVHPGERYDGNTNNACHYGDKCDRWPECKYVHTAPSANKDVQWPHPNPSLATYYRDGDRDTHRKVDVLDIIGAHENQDRMDGRFKAALEAKRVTADAVVVHAALQAFYIKHRENSKLVRIAEEVK